MIPEYLLAELIPRTPCPGCGAADRVIRFQYPQITIGETHDELYLVGYCDNCRIYSPLHFRVPRLLLGFILLQPFEQRARLRLDAKRSITIGAQVGDALTRLAREFRELMSRTPRTADLELQRTERQAFGMDLQSFDEFLRRLGFANNSEKPQ